MTPEEKRIEELENLLRPFAEAYRLHLRDERRVNELKTVMAKDTSVEEWRAAYVELYGAVPVHVSEQANEV